jgi:uncharacterized repeat protein (TIGR01451 family)
MSRSNRNNGSAMGAWIVASALLLAASGAHAQVQRSFVNPSFEEPELPGTACWSIRESADVPGWRTTEPPYNGTWGNSQHGTCGGHPDRPVIESMQIFKNGWTGMQAQDGAQWAELNAQTPSRLYQTVCLAPGERVDWSLAHRGRSGGERMSFNIGPNADGTGNVEIMQATSNTAGAGTINACGSAGTCSYDGVVNTWATYSGSFIWSGAPGLQTIGFEAISGGSTGNYLDNIQLTLRPYVEFFPEAVVSGEADGSANVPAIRVAGMITTAFDVIVNITGGTAELGTDFTAPGTSFVVNIPVGDYGTGQDFPLPLAVIEDALVEGDETVTLGIAEDTASYAIGSTSACGTPANADITWTIADNDVDLAITKDDGAATYVPGSDVTYTIVVTNNGPLPVAGARVADPLPAGIVTASWTCDAGTGGGTCGGAGGTGALDTTADLPAGGSITYVLTMAVPADFSGDLANVATVDAPAGFTDIDTGDNTATDTDTAAPRANLTIVKTASDDQVTSGGQVSYTLQVTNNGPDAADGAVLTDPPVSGLDCSTGTLTCGMETSGAICPAAPAVVDLQGGGVAIDTFPAGSSLQFVLTCTVTATGNP